MKKITSKGNWQTRRLITREAARLMYEEGVEQYYDAKRQAAKHVLGHSCKNYKLQLKHLPSNGEISDELANLVQFYEGDRHKKRLFAMRVIALDYMKDLDGFYPRLIGSVSTGKVRSTSDIDLHVFTDNIESLECHIRSLSWDFETRQITIRKNNKFLDYTHIYINGVFPVELSVYPYKDIRIQGRSSTDGKPIIRLKYQTLLSLILQEHNKEWQHYLSTNEIVGLPY